MYLVATTMGSNFTLILRWANRPNFSDASIFTFRKRFRRLIMRQVQAFQILNSSQYCGHPSRTLSFAPSLRLWLSEQIFDGGNDYVFDHQATCPGKPISSIVSVKFVIQWCLVLIINLLVPVRPPRLRTRLYKRGPKTILTVGIHCSSNFQFFFSRARSPLIFLFNVISCFEKSSNDLLSHSRFGSRHIGWACPCSAGSNRETYWPNHLWFYETLATGLRRSTRTFYIVSILNGTSTRWLREERRTSAAASRCQLSRACWKLGAFVISKTLQIPWSTLRNN